MSDDSLVVPEAEQETTSVLEVPVAPSQEMPAGDPNFKYEKNQPLPPALTAESVPVAPSDDSGSLLADDFTAEDARQELAKESKEDTNEPVMAPEDYSPENKNIAKPVFWLVGIFCVLAVAIFVAWLLAK